MAGPRAGASFKHTKRNLTLAGITITKNLSGILVLRGTWQRWPDGDVTVMSGCFIGGHFSSPVKSENDDALSITTCP
jgi:hypothetical protein